MANRGPSVSYSNSPYLLHHIMFNNDVVQDWNELCSSDLALSLIKDLPPETIPDENARINKDGTLTLYVRLPNGSELSMDINEDNWSWISDEQPGSCHATN